MDFIEKWDASGSILIQDESNLNAYFQSRLTEFIKVPDGYVLAGSGSDLDPYLLLVNPPAVVTSEVTQTSGTFDDGEGTTYQQTLNQIIINTTSANWETMAVRYEVNGQTITDAVYKKMANGTSSGVLTKISNTEVRINITNLNQFLYGIVYNGGSVGSFSFSF